MDKKVVVITGAAGYVGEMLCEQFSRRDDVAQVVAIDKSPQTDFLGALSKLVYLQHNLADSGWEEAVEAYEPTVIVHAAWQIRSLYGRADTQWQWNIEGSKRVFAFAFATPSVRTLIHFSTAASYSARSDNTLTQYFTEDDQLREDDYAYAREKKFSETLLREAYACAKTATRPAVVIFRPAAITGPRGRYLRTRFGLQSAVVGNDRAGFLARLVAIMMVFMPATRGFVRQFVHEDDVVDVVLQCSVNDQVGYEVYNLTPEGAPLTAPAMAAAVGKRVVLLPVSIIRVVFGAFWYVTRGRIPTAPGSWRFYAYPILMSGAKLAQMYTCRYNTSEAFSYTDGRFESKVPTHLKKSNPLKK